MATRSTNDFHARLRGIEEGLAGDDTGVLSESVRELTVRVGMLSDGLRGQTELTRAVAGLTEAVTFAAALDYRIARLEAQHLHALWQRRQRVPRMMIYGISPTRRSFVASEPSVSAIRAAGYQTIDDLIAEQPTASEDAADVAYAKVVAAHRADPSKVEAPPDAEEFRDFFRICQEMVNPTSD